MDNREAAMGTVGIILPVRIDYIVLEALIKERMVGETIQVEKENGDVTKYARILDVSLSHSPEQEYDLAVDIKLTTLTSFFNNKEARIFFQAAIIFDREHQVVLVNDYKLKVDSQSWLMNKSLQTVANTFAHNKLKSKMRFDFTPEIRKQLSTLNRKLENSFEVTEGIFLNGSIHTMRIVEFQPLAEHIRVVLEGDGDADVNIRSLNIGS